MNKLIAIILLFASASALAFLSPRPQSSGASFSNSRILLTGYTGYGSTNNKVLRFTSITTNQPGSDLSVAQSASDGDSITILTAGKYEASVCAYSFSAQYIAITVNSSALTTAPSSIAPPQNRVMVAVPAGLSNCAVRTITVSANDVVRAQADGAAMATDAQYTNFLVTKIH